DGQPGADLAHPDTSWVYLLRLQLWAGEEIAADADDRASPQHGGAVPVSGPGLSAPLVFAAVHAALLPVPGTAAGCDDGDRPLWVGDELGGAAAGRPHRGGPDT